jgi:hypothetical protein
MYAIIFGLNWQVRSNMLHEILHLVLKKSRVRGLLEICRSLHSSPEELVETADLVSWINTYQLTYLESCFVCP